MTKNKNLTSESVFRNYKKTINLPKILGISENESIEDYIFDMIEGGLLSIDVMTNEEMK